jgi:rubredoxin
MGCPNCGVEKVTFSGHPDYPWRCDVCGYRPPKPEMPLGKPNPETKRYVISDQPAGNQPRLMLIFRSRMSCEKMAIVRERVNEDLAGSKSIIMDSGVEAVFQLINGRWIALDGKTELEDAPAPEKVNFRKFL